MFTQWTRGQAVLPYGLFNYYFFRNKFKCLTSFNYLMQCTMETAWFILLLHSCCAKVLDFSNLCTDVGTFLHLSGKKFHILSIFLLQQTHMAGILLTVLNSLFFLFCYISVLFLFLKPENRKNTKVL